MNEYELSNVGKSVLKHLKSKNHINQYGDEILSDGDYINYLLQNGEISIDDAYYIAENLNNR